MSQGGKHMRKHLIASLVVCSVIFASAIIGAAGNYTYNADIKTILNQNGCISCHQFMNTYATFMSTKSTNSPTTGLLIVYPAKPDSSVIVWRLEGKTAGGTTVNTMPLDGDKLGTDTIQKIRDWITQGASEEVVGVDDQKRWGDIKRMFR